MIYTIFRRRSYYAARAKRGSCKVFSRLKPKECTRNYTYLQFVMKHHTTNILFWRMCSLVCRTVHIKYTLLLMENGELINCLTSDKPMIRLPVCSTCVTKQYKHWETIHDPIELFLVPASTPPLVLQTPRYVLSRL